MRPLNDDTTALRRLRLGQSLTVQDILGCYLLKAVQNSYQWRGQYAGRRFKTSRATYDVWGNRLLIVRRVK